MIRVNILLPLNFCLKITKNITSDGISIQMDVLPLIFTARPVPTPPNLDNEQKKRRKGEKDPPPPRLHKTHSHFFATIPSGGLVSTFAFDTSAQLVLRDVPLLSTKLFIIARCVSGSALA